MSSRYSHSPGSVSRASSRQGSISSQLNETLLLECYLHVGKLKRTKIGYKINQIELNKLLQKGRKKSVLPYKVCFYEDRIRYTESKRTGWSHKHPTVLYENVKGAFHMENNKRIVILAVEYARTHDTRYETHIFKTEEDAERAKDILRRVKLFTMGSTGLYPNGRYSVYSVGSHSEDLDDHHYSRSSSVPALENRYMHSRYAMDDRDNGSKYRSESCTDVTKYQEPICETEHIGRQSQHSAINVSYRAPSELDSRRQPTSDVPVEYTKYAKHTPRHESHGENGRTNVGWENSHDGTSSTNDINFLADTDPSFFSQPGSTIYLHMDKLNGLHIVDEGPIYMYCESMPFNVTVH